MKRTQRALLLIIGSAGLLLVGAGCPPSYPNCATDDQCKERGEVCVGGSCKQCRDDSNCNPNGTRPCMQCGEDRLCAKKFKCCTSDLDCPGEKCLPNQQFPDRPGSCVDKCHGVQCPPGQKCEGGQCVPEGCVSDDQCQPGEKCINGKCVKQACEMQKIYFDYDEARIRLDQENAINANVQCVKGGGDYTLEGHCDERGDGEYNLALGQRRANAVLRAYKAAGVDKDKLKTISYGFERPACNDHNEECWRQNRRVETVSR